MPTAIYQKYRPKRWADIADQQHIKTTLEHEIERGKIAHAYIFVGPRGVGKTTIARLFAKAVNCEKLSKGSAEPCNGCDSCARIDAQRSLDLVEIDAASNTGVDHVREHILTSAEITAGHGKYRVFIIDEVHMLSTAAFNAMLKILEEPPPHVIFILATTEAHKVPATIISRCQRFDFRRISAGSIRDRLRGIVKAEGVQVADEVLEEIAEHAEGALRDAESMLGQVLSLNEKKITIEEASLVLPRSNLNMAAELIGLCLAGKTGEAVAFINSRVEEGVSVSVFMKDIISWLRDLLLSKVSERLDLSSRNTLGDLQKKITEQSSAATAEQLQKMIDVFLVRRRNLSDAPLPQLPFELAVIEVCVETKGDSVTKKIQEINDNPPKTKQGSGADESSSGDYTQGKENNIKLAKAVKDEAPSHKTRSSDATSSFELADIQARWGDVLDSIKKVSHALSFVLSGSEPVRVSGKTIDLAVKHKFHRDRLSEPKNQTLLKETIKTVFGVEPIIQAILEGEK